ncbi:MAG: ABC transporter permease [Terriglobia bacterium]
MSFLREIRLHWRREFSENLWMALDALRGHKARSFLTVLGIIVAVVTLVSVVAILYGFDSNIQAEMQGFGVNNVFFYHMNMGVQVGRRSAEERMRKPIEYDDYLALRDACTACEDATVWLFRSGIERARYKEKEILAPEFQGVPVSYFDVMGNATLKRGRAFTQGESEHRVYVAVIGQEMVKGLFGEEDPLDKEIRVEGYSWRVIGIFEKPPGEASDEDDRVIVPYWTFRKSYPLEKRHLIVAKAQDGRLAEATDQGRMSLRRSRGVPFDKPDNFDFETANSVIAQFHDLVAVVALVVVVIASVGLMIGGVGVMNIMLVSVTERTREIGVRKAIGARRRDIIWQFLTEAMTLTGAGGVIGVIVSWGISTLIRATVPAIPSFIPLWAVLLGVGVAGSVGLFFGLYPAVKAARLDPVVALRYE